MEQRRRIANGTSHWAFDPYFLLALLGLITLGLIMVTSASISVAAKSTEKPFYFAFQQGTFLFVGAIGALIVWGMSFKLWQRLSPLFMLGALFLLIVVFIPGLGRTVNGSTRWLNVGITAIQVSELAKFGMILFISSYVVKQGEKLKTNFVTFLIPLVVLAIVGGLLLLEPDFGATVVIAGTVFGLLFLAGVRLTWFLGIILLAAGAFTALAFSAPYRIRRLTSFLNPWEDQFDSGYQLTQALIAFGRGEWFGVGLGASVQKLFYLPEAHCDFVFAVIAEELGLIGALSVIVLFALFVIRGMRIGMMAQQRGDTYAAFVCYGVTLWIGLQALVNIGVNTGVLPTKGLTLPFISYGGSSLVVLCVAVSLIIKVDLMNRAKKLSTHAYSPIKRRLGRERYAQ